MEQLLNQPSQPRAPLLTVFLNLGMEVSDNQFSSVQSLSRVRREVQKRGREKGGQDLEYVCTVSEREMSRPLCGLDKPIMLRKGCRPCLQVQH